MFTMSLYTLEEEVAGLGLGFIELIVVPELAARLLWGKPGVQASFAGGTETRRGFLLLVSQARAGAMVSQSWQVRWRNCGSGHSSCIIRLLGCPAQPRRFLTIMKTTCFNHPSSYPSLPRTSSGWPGHNLPSSSPPIPTHMFEDSALCRCHPGLHPT